MNVKKIAWMTVTSAALGTSLVGVGLNAASAGSGPSATAVSATFANSPVPGTTKTRQCTGTDGAPYLHVQEIDRGPMTSTDPRLTGIVEVHIQDLLVNLATGVGSATGTTTIRDADTGQLKATGTLVEALNGDALKGLVTAHLTDGGTVIANVSGHVDFATGTVTGELGTDSTVPADLATIVAGTC